MNLARMRTTAADDERHWESVDDVILQCHRAYVQRANYHMMSRGKDVVTVQVG